MSNTTIKKIPFRTEGEILINLQYNDCVYAWLLLHSHYDPNEDHNYIYKDDFSFNDIAKDIGRSRQTVSRRFKELLQETETKEGDIIPPIVRERDKYYIIPCSKDFSSLHSDTVIKLLRLPIKEQKEELIKTYAFLLKKKREANKEGYDSFNISHKQIIEEFGHSTGHKQTYDRVRAILTILQGAGIIKFRTVEGIQNSKGDFTGTQMWIYEINDKASDEWLGITKEEYINRVFNDII
jgi:hypothetical protein